jgi:ribonuclease BN (tRNA processing enzyme)
MPVLHQLHNYFGRLAAAGVEPDAVDYVLITHLHSDHDVQCWSILQIVKPSISAVTSRLRPSGK